MSNFNCFQAEFEKWHKTIDSLPIEDKLQLTNQEKKNKVIKNSKINDNHAFNDKLYSSDKWEIQGNNGPVGIFPSLEIQLPQISQNNSNNLPIKKSTTINNSLSNKNQAYKKQYEAAKKEQKNFYLTEIEDFNALYSKLFNISTINTDLNNRINNIVILFYNKLTENNQILLDIKSPFEETISSKFKDKLIKKTNEIDRRFNLDYEKFIKTTSKNQEQISKCVHDETSNSTIDSKKLSKRINSKKYRQNAKLKERELYNTHTKFELLSKKFCKIIKMPQSLDFIKNISNSFEFVMKD
jgi:hypothetical protein